MDTWALIIIAASLFMYFVTKRKNFFVLTTGIGIGLLIGALWAAAIVFNAFP